MLLPEWESHLAATKEKMTEVITNFKYELNKISAGRVTPLILEGILVDYYGTMTPINQLASITIIEGRQLIIKPYDRNIIKNIIGAINKINLQVSLQDQGDYIRMIVPQLTSERRQEYVKQTKKIAEEMRIRIRNLRRDINEVIKKTQLPQDIAKDYQNTTQKLTDEYIQQIETILTAKEKDLTTV